MAQFEWNDVDQILLSSSWLDFDMDAMYRNRTLLWGDMNVRSSFDTIVKRMFSDRVLFKEANEIIDELEGVETSFIKSGFERLVNEEWGRFLVDALEWIWIAGFVPVIFVPHAQYGSIPQCLRPDAIKIQYRTSAVSQTDFRYRSIVRVAAEQDQAKLSHDQTVHSFAAGSKRQKLDHAHRHLMGETNIPGIKTFVFENVLATGAPNSILTTAIKELEAWLTKLRVIKLDSARDMGRPQALVSTATQKDLTNLAAMATETLGVRHLLSDVKFGAPASKGPISRDDLTLLATGIERQLASQQDLVNRWTNGLRPSTQDSQRSAVPAWNAHETSGQSAVADNTLRRINLGPDDKPAFVPHLDAVHDFKDIENMRTNLVSRLLCVPNVLFNAEANGAKTRQRSVGPDDPAEKILAATCAYHSKRLGIIAEELFATIYHDELAWWQSSRTKTPVESSTAMFTNRVNFVFQSNIEPAAVDRLLDMGALPWRTAVETFARRYQVPVDALNSEPYAPLVNSIGFDKGQLQAQMEFKFAMAQDAAKADHKEGKRSGGRKPLFDEKFMTHPADSKLAAQVERDRRTPSHKAHVKQGAKKGALKRVRQHQLEGAVS